MDFLRPFFFVNDGKPVSNQQQCRHQGTDLPPRGRFQMEEDDMRTDIYTTNTDFSKRYGLKIQFLL